MVDGLSVGNLMLFQAVALIESLKTVLALEFWLMWNVVGVVCWSICVGPRLPRFWLFSLLVLPLFMFLQILFAVKCLIAKTAVEEKRRRNSFLLNFNIQSN